MTTKYIIDGVEYANKPAYLEKDGLMRPVIAEHFNIEVIETPEATAEQLALAQNIFTKLQIRRAMRVIGNEAILDGLLTNEAFKKDWADAVEIDLSDPMTAAALASVQVDINAVKLQIAGIEQNV
jgi:hypothetical protein